MLRRVAIATSVSVPVAFAGGCLLYRYQHRPQLPPHSLPAQTDKVVVITGATSGIGHAVALKLSELGGTIVIGCRDTSRGEVVQREIAAAGGSIEVLPLELSSPHSVLRFCTEVRKKHAVVDTLLCSGAEILSEQVLTEDGIDKAFATNALGSYGLVRALEPALLKSQDPRVVLVGSRLERKGSQFSIEALEKSSGRSLLQDGHLMKDGMEHYAITKRALSLLGFALRRCWQDAGVPVTLFIVTPGMVHTNLWANFPLWYRAITYPVRALALRSPQDAAAGVVYAAAAPEALAYGQSYAYLADGALISPSDGAASATDGKRLLQICRLLLDRCLAS